MPEFFPAEVMRSWAAQRTERYRLWILGLLAVGLGLVFLFRKRRGLLEFPRRCSSNLHDRHVVRCLNVFEVVYTLANNPIPPSSRSQPPSALVLSVRSLRQNADLSYLYHRHSSVLPGPEFENSGLAKCVLVDAESRYCHPGR
jgi:hypothetical protein